MTDILQYDNHYNKVAEGLGIHAEGFSEHTKNLEPIREINQSSLSRMRQQNAN